MCNIDLEWLFFNDNIQVSKLYVQVKDMVTCSGKIYVQIK